MPALALATSVAAAEPVTGPLGQAAIPITGEAGDYAELLRVIGDAQIVLLGEATHGTSDFYRERARVTLRLVRERGFGAVAIEADAPEAERVNRYVRGIGADRSGQEALAGFARFPRWMWRNVEFRDFIDALRADNLTRPPASRVGVYGIDVYDMFGALDHVQAYTRARGPAAAQAVRGVAACLAPYRRSTQAYGVAARRPGRSCEVQVAALLSAIENLPRSGEEDFAVLRNAGALAAGEAYYRAVYVGAYSWNVRERSMAAAVRVIASHVRASGRPGKVVVWAHNSHVGSAQSTEMARRGEVSVADLLRGEAGGSVFSLGFLTRTGTMMAAPAWDRPGQVFRLAPAARTSVEALLARSGLGRSLLLLGGRAVGHVLAEERPQRAVGAVFDPAKEPGYLSARLATQFDAVAFLDATSAVQPLR